MILFYEDTIVDFNYSASVTSTDRGTTWISAAPTYESDQLITLAANGSNLCGFHSSGSGTYWSVSNNSGASWTQHSYGSGAFKPSGVVEKDGYFYAATADGKKCWSSADGVTWTDRGVLTSGSWFCWEIQLIRTANYIVALPASYEAVNTTRSATGLGGWTTGPLVSLNVPRQQITLQVAVNGDSILFIDNNANEAAYSVDGLNWTKTATTGLPSFGGTGGGLYLTYHNGEYIAAGVFDDTYNGNGITLKTATSVDGVTWANEITHSEPLDGCRMAAAYDGCFYYLDDFGDVTIVCRGASVCTPFWTNYVGQREVVL